MSLKETLNKEKIASIKSVGALKNSEVETLKVTAEIRLATIRAALTAITEEETSESVRKELTDAEIIAVLKRMVKQRTNSAKEYGAAGATARQLREIAEIQHLEEFIPAPLDEAATRTLVTGIVKDLVDRNILESGPRAIGQVMAAFEGRSDINRGLASRIVRELL